MAIGDIAGTRAPDAERTAWALEAAGQVGTQHLWCTPVRSEHAPSHACRRAGANIGSATFAPEAATPRRHHARTDVSRDTPYEREVLADDVGDKVDFVRREREWFQAVFD